ncbi:MAG: hypothetical protein A2086_07200 [Spirochaetes bacterium GWD1_27_9]|nr:MAG: hypothetical protein A2Z98_11645 [Spirochaetes bacterium GWB1_27_13]OHD25695.1 MAG: hypothetical protein A2Y34_14355 [Spirochaetes bacterium GWC1_27_15]OHD32188.1 MAG: hypothetical protein A2086_07200 [Spirochaetes bacterium GWD1_27_9]
MLTKNNIIDYISSNREYIFKEFGIKQIGLFGSFACDKQKNDSDIDIIVEFQNNIEDIYDKKMQLSEILKKQFDREIDIARLKYLKERVKSEILKEVIYIE